MSGRGVNIRFEGLAEAVRALEHGIDELPDVIEGALQGEGGEAIKSHANRLIRHKSGKARMQKRATTQGVLIRMDSTAHITGQGLSSILESGSDPHVIRAKDGGALLVRGRPVEQVNHPGTRPQKIMQRTLRATKWEVEAAVIDEFDRRRWAAQGG